ncbi:MAG: hypothetical protein ABI643_01180 [Candidatus Doudnabacteria bacterium]
MKNIKVDVLGLVSVVLWTADWFLLRQGIIDGKSPIFWLWAVLASITAISFLTFFYLTNKSRRTALVVEILTIAGYVLVMPKDPAVILGGGLFLILMFLFEWRIRSEEKNSVDFSMRRVISNSVSVMIYAILLLIGCIVYYNTQADFLANPDAYYQRLGQAAAKTVPYFTKDLPAGVDFNQTLDQFLSNQAKTTNPSVIRQYRADFFKQFQIKAVSGNQSLADVFAQIATDKLRQASLNYEGYFPFVFAIIVTGLLLTFAFLLNWTTQLICWVLFRILLAVKFFKLAKIQVEVERLTV